MTRSVALAVCSAVLFAQPAKEPRLPYKANVCPCDAKLGDQATLKLPEGFSFVDRENAGKFLESTENLASGDEFGIVLSPDGWFAVFSFDPVGYVKDDEKDTLDADELMKTKMAHNKEANTERVRRGWTEVQQVGWFEKPFYSQVTNNLEWSTIIESGGGRTINHSSRYLGRRGVMSATLVSDDQGIGESLTAFRTAMKSFEFTPDNHYRAFTKGDKVAEYGLSALVLGGAAAAAAKSGLLKSLVKLLAAFWKVIVFAVLALGGAIMRLFRRAEPEEVEPSAEQSEEPSR